MSDLLAYNYNFSTIIMRVFFPLLNLTEIPNEICLRFLIKIITKTKYDNKNNEIENKFLTTTKLINF